MRAQASTAVGDPTAAAAWVTGQAMALDEAVAYALAEPDGAPWPHPRVRTAVRRCIPLGRLGCVEEVARNGAGRVRRGGR